MHRIVLLLALLTPIAPFNNITGSPAVNQETSTISTTAPIIVFKNIPRPATPKPRRTSLTKGKSDSPMLNYIFDTHATNNKHFHDKFKAPSFEVDISSDDATMEADTGATVFFDCRVNSLRDKMVSWLRVHDDENLELLTLDLDTHTADSRYRVDLAGETWRLALLNAKVTDSGIYCCHVSTHPPMLKRFKLVVHRPEIKLTKEAFLESGETLTLKCMILHLHSEEIPPAIRWYRANSSVPLDEIRGGILIETDQLTFTSHIQVAQLRMEDAGNYTCAMEAPLNIKAVARVHVLQGSSLAELQGGVKTANSNLNILLATTLVVFGTSNDVR